MLLPCIILKVNYIYIQGSDLILLAGVNFVTLPPKLTYIQQLNHWFNLTLTQINTPVSSLVSVRVSTARQAEHYPHTPGKTTSCYSHMCNRGLVTNAKSLCGQALLRDWLESMKR